jgi:hypothetical protein
LDVEIIARLLRDRKGQTFAAREALFYEIVLTRWHEIAGSKVRPLDLPLALFALLRIHLRYIR